MFLTPDLIKQRLKNLGVVADKFLGQHFLVDASVLDTIRGKVKEFLPDGRTVVEVGPGLGVLTDVLTQAAERVIALEKDPVFAQALGSFLAKDNLTVVQGDALRLLETNQNFPKQFIYGPYASVQQVGTGVHHEGNAVSLDDADTSWLFVANIPYAITSPLLRMLTELTNPPRHILVLMQKEVAERLVAQPGNSDRGLLTIQMELVGKTEIVQLVPPSSFWPEPKVESALVHIDLAESTIRLTETERKAFFKVVTAGFLMKRKKIHNSLTAGLSLPNGQVKQLLEKANIDANRRAETLTLDEWWTLAEAYASL